MVGYSSKILCQILLGLTHTPASEREKMVSIACSRRLKLREIKRLAQGYTAYWW